MRPKTIIGIIAIALIILGVIIISFANKNDGRTGTPTPSPTITTMPTGTSTHTPTYTPTATHTPTSTPSGTPTPTPTLTATFMVVCTPPACAIGTSEAYYCPGICNGGCGTTCATYTPTP
jgi:hypothetical protein